jgi:hypothetical protein
MQDRPQTAAALREQLDAQARTDGSQVSAWLEHDLEALRSWAEASALVGQDTPQRRQAIATLWPQLAHDLAPMSRDGNDLARMRALAMFCAAPEGLSPAQRQHLEDTLARVHDEASHRPWRFDAVSESAQLWADALQRDDDSTGQLFERLAETAHSPLRPVPDAHLKLLAQQARLRAELGHWQAWAQALVNPLRDHLVALFEPDELVLYAADHELELDRVVLGVCAQGEVSLARSGRLVLLEWDGDGTPPHVAQLDGRPLASIRDRSPAAACWLLDQPPTTPAQIVLWVQGSSHTLALP